MGSVVGIGGTVVHGASPEPDQDVVEILEDWLQRAKDGSLVQVAMVGVTREHTVITNWQGHVDHHLVVYGTTILHGRVLNRALELQEDVNAT